MTPAGLRISPEQIAARIAEIGSRISADYEDRSPVLIGVLKGSIPFMADLARRMTIQARFDFMAISSYGSGNSGVVRILKDVDLPLHGEDVVLVEDIVDTGLTATYLTATLRERRPGSLALCTLLDKAVRRIVDVPIRYTGFEIPDEFVVGFGLDHHGRYRNLPGIAGVRNLSVLEENPEALDTWPPRE